MWPDPAETEDLLVRVAGDDPAAEDRLWERHREPLVDVARPLRRAHPEHVGGGLLAPAAAGLRHELAPRVASAFEYGDAGPPRQPLVVDRITA